MRLLLRIWPNWMYNSAIRISILLWMSNFVKKTTRISTTNTSASQELGLPISQKIVFIANANILNLPRPNSGAWIKMVIFLNSENTARTSTSREQSMRKSTNVLRTKVFLRQLNTAVESTKAKENTQRRKRGITI